MTGDAVLSPCGQYRYVLRRHWETLTGVGAPLFVMLNPSTADAVTDDATIRRCRRFAEDGGFAGLTVVNLYAFRATSPKVLWRVSDPVGPENDHHLCCELEGRTGPIICAWGSHARPARVHEFIDLTDGAELHCLGTTKGGHPRHPLYLRRDTELQDWLP